VRGSIWEVGSGPGSRCQPRSPAPCHNRRRHLPWRRASKEQGKRPREPWAIPRNSRRGPFATAPSPRPGSAEAPPDFSTESRLPYTANRSVVGSPAGRRGVERRRVVGAGPDPSQVAPLAHRASRVAKGAFIIAPGTGPLAACFNLSRLPSPAAVPASTLPRRVALIAHRAGWAVFKIICLCGRADCRQDFITRLDKLSYLHNSRSETLFLTSVDATLYAAPVHQGGGNGQQM
jgi:hypothetical protein